MRCSNKAMHSEKPVKKAVVIGARSGIGRSLATILARNGHAVGVMARRLSCLEELKAQEENITHARQVDVRDAETAMGELVTLMGEMGGVDLVVISAGTGDINGPLDWAPELETIQTNVTGFAALANVAMGHFMARGSGHLVGISSIAALRGGRESPAYNASKAFMSNYLEGLRQKVTRARLPITITDIQPGFVQTAMAKGEGIGGPDQL